MLSFVYIVTEKSNDQANEGQYHFRVPSNSNKVQIKQDLEKLYGKKVATVRVVQVKSKTRNLGRKTMTKRKPYKKAIVTFVGKQKIEINNTK